MGLLKVRSVNLAELATGFSGGAKDYKRLQRFFRTFELDQAALAPLLVRLLGGGEGPWRLAMDWPHGQFGQTYLNFLVLGLVHRGIALPLFRTVLDKPGTSGTPEYIALMRRVLQELWGLSDCGVAGGSGVRRRGVVLLATTTEDSLPPTPQAQYPRARH